MKSSNLKDWEGILDVFFHSELQIGSVSVEQCHCMEYRLKLKWLIYFS